MHIDFEPGKLVNEVKTHLPDVTDLVCEFVHGAPYLDLLLQHRRDARETQAKSNAEPPPNVRPIGAVKADELHRPYQGGKA